MLTQTLPLDCAAAISGLEAAGEAVLLAFLGAAMLPEAGVDAGAGAAAGAGALTGAAVFAAEPSAAGAVSVAAAFDFLLLFLVVVSAGAAAEVASAGAAFEVLSASAATFLLLRDFFEVVAVESLAVDVSAEAAFPLSPSDALLFFDFFFVVVAALSPAAEVSAAALLSFFDFFFDFLVVVSVVVSAAVDCAFVSVGAIVTISIRQRASVQRVNFFCE